MAMASIAGMFTRLGNHQPSAFPAPLVQGFSAYGYGSIPIDTFFSGMIIHLPAILGFTRYQGFDPSPYLRLKGLDLRLADAASPSTIRLDDANDGGTINGQPGGLRNPTELHSAGATIIGLV